MSNFNLSTETEHLEMPSQFIGHYKDVSTDHYDYMYEYIEEDNEYIKESNEYNNCDNKNIIGETYNKNMRLKKEKRYQKLQKKIQQMLSHEINTTSKSKRENKSKNKKQSTHYEI
jgi:hypothetical protein